MRVNNFTSTNNMKKSWLTQCSKAGHYLANVSDILCQSTNISADTPGQASNSTQSDLLDSRAKSGGQHGIPEQGQAENKTLDELVRENLQFKRELNICEICGHILGTCICIKDLEICHRCVIDTKLCNCKKECTKCKQNILKHSMNRL